jgi:adenylate cyclase
VDWQAQGLLDGLDGDAREARARLLDELHGAGIGLGELRRAVAEDRLVLLPTERALLSEPRYTLGQIARLVGLEPAVAERRFRAAGVTLPEDRDEPAFSEEDLAAARRQVAFRALGLPDDEMEAVVRVMSAAIARAAEPMRRLFAESYLHAGDSELDLGRRYSEMAYTLLPLVAEDLDYLLRRRLQEFARHEAITFAERRAGHLAEATDITVAFADIVGFTRLGQEMPEDELFGIADRLEALAIQHTTRPTRFVKAIGDAVMLVSPEPACLIADVLALGEAASALPGFPPLRAGIAHGRAIPRLGDWYGPAVNLAARVAERARPDSVLVTREVLRALDEGERARFTFSPAGVRHLRGLEEPVSVFRARPRVSARDA